jgi:hypothetical protein
MSKSQGAQGAGCFLKSGFVASTPGKEDLRLCFDFFLFPS